MDRDPSNACALDFGSFVDLPIVGPAAKLLGPKRAKIEKNLCDLPSLGGKGVRIRLEGEPSIVILDRKG